MYVCMYVCMCVFVSISTIFVIYRLHASFSCRNEFGDMNYDPISICAEYMLRRNLSVHSLLSVIENFFCIRGLYPSVARRYAQKVKEDIPLSIYELLCMNRLIHRF